MVPPTLSGTRSWHLSGFFCTSLLTPSAAPTVWPVEEGEDEWWFPEKLLGRGGLAQSPPEVSLVTHGQPYQLSAQEHFPPSLRAQIWDTPLNIQQRLYKTFQLEFLFLFSKPTKPFLLNAKYSNQGTPSA